MECERCGFCCTEMEVTAMEIAFPEAMLPEIGLSFMKATGLIDDIRMGKKLRVIHTCQHLTTDKLCGIEADKPAFCKLWDCRRHLREKQWFQDRKGEFAISTMEDISELLMEIRMQINQEGVSVEDKIETLKRFISEVAAATTEYTERTEKLAEVK